MPFQGVLTSLLLPPLLLVLFIVAAGLLAWRGRRAAGALAAAAALGLLLLATPFAAGTLTHALERQAALAAPAGAPPPAAIIVLGGEMASGAGAPEVGPLTLERLRAGAALHRRTGLPLLVTAGPVAPGGPPLAELMARSLAEDFGVEVRWVENRARDTRDNAVLSAEMLRAEGIGAAYVVSHAWHLARAEAAFARLGFPVTGYPVRRERMPSGIASDWLPRPDHLARSWFALREWAGILVYWLRDG
ncbi:YdcF family protein [Falsiroseomonas bella]|uniref:YdcF family protein n=1 Tax=Falsiroseomonas bella TaxID=2184016 RepID=A0A317F773_9PROT|nr:YdcF family protein [Falsiroseomonas bella]PWS34253.1 YdcF family protein [Falsiroseomonas bella]